ncbi:hypothetical protein BY458DRAFT_480508 [Sporodiniella umbellata]|nr:hypothetical protein BY458DRAFT_480508 [Sporodiniella umbellata]
MTSETTTVDKKKKTTTEIPAFYTQAFKNYPVQLKQTKAKGRHAVASEALSEGITVSMETAAAFVVRSEFLDQHCHSCLTDLDDSKKGCECGTAFYCSNNCLKKDTLHDTVCSAMKQVKAIANSTDVDVDLLRLMLLLLSRRSLGDQTSAPFWCVEDLLSHVEEASSDFKQAVGSASERILSELPESLQIPKCDMIALACRINNNAHGLGDQHGRNTDIAFGLFPLGALFFNHSCNPNTAFVGLPNGQLAFRTIRPVKKDEELVVSYIDVYSCRDERRQELLTTKHFWCKCKRCTETMEKSVDRFLQGVVCHKCEKDVYLVPATNIDHLIRGKTSVILEKSFKCASCGYEINQEELKTALEAINETYAKGITHIQQHGDYAKARQQLEKAAKQPEKGGNACSIHSVRFNSLIPLMNCLRHGGDLKNAIQVNKSILFLIEQYADIGGLPKNTQEYSDFAQNLGELCEKVANQSGNSILKKKWMKEAHKAYSQALASRSVTFGKAHHKTLIIEQALRKVKI